MIKNRKEAGIKLGERFKKLMDEGKIVEPVVVAIPRGGVEVGAEIAKILNAPLDLIFVKKLPAPNNPELAIGAVSEAGQIFVNQDMIEYLKNAGIEIDERYLQERGIELIQEMARKRDYYKVEPIPLEGKDVIIVDDGVATGSSIYLAAQSIVRDLPRSISIAVPVAPAEESVLNMLRGISHHQEILETHSPFISVSRWYEDFPQLNDEKVKEILKSL